MGTKSTLGAKTLVLPQVQSEKEKKKGTHLPEVKHNMHIFL